MPAHDAAPPGRGGGGGSSSNTNTNTNARLGPTASASTSNLTSQPRSGRHDGQSLPQPAPLSSGAHQLTDTESWIEVSSHPSSSSVSSIGDEIVTTGLHVRNSYAARRRRLHPQSYAHLTSAPQQQQQQHQQQLQGHPQQYHVGVPRSVHGGTSSQEEYDESDSEDDRVLTSSTENIASPTPLRQVPDVHDVEAVLSSDEELDDDDDDDHATALGRRTSESFRPQPNAFSHPPSHLTHRHSTSAIPPHHPRPSFSQRSQTRTDRGRGNPNFMSPTYQADNDAALRASLTTLLSVAAAARGLPKEGEKELGERAGIASGGQPVELRLVPESELMAPSCATAPSSQDCQQPQRTSGSPPTTSRKVSGEKVKRSTTPTGTSKSPRATKKKKLAAVSAADETYISPTLMTWVVSAGVVVLVSVVGFGAGYVIGREVGRQESLSSLGAGNASAVSDGSNCGREVLRSGGGGLRRFRWGATVGKSVTV